MAQRIKDMFLVSPEEYEKLTNPDVTYTLLTKTAAKKLVTHLLKKTGFVCWHDDPEIDPDDFCCSSCPVYKFLGDDAGDRVCIKQKAWSK